ncbi:hypothetical protein BpHYR1_024123 [Brachionus plicatilis]|uniref:G-protein coupled receptors family 1 profile domain-containing protein n=1 Tax=Brachionus plicatilis TaxID=10195 RepID=A0A3M7TA90_BRAPC|nr:hypothetical protein BpHYR1_024123 [Brachionus plicatilis]
MNDSLFTEFYDTEIFADSQSKRVLKLIQEFFTPMLSLLGFTLRLVCIFVYMKPVKNSMNKILKLSYTSINKTLLLNSLSQAIFSFVYIFLPVIYCRNICMNNGYLSNFFHAYVVIYGSTVAEMISILANIVMCLNRFLIIFKNKDIFRLMSFRSMCFIIILFSLMVNLPYLKMVKIDMKNGKYFMTESDFSKSATGQFFKNFIPVIRYFVLIAIFVTINFLLLYNSFIFAKNREKFFRNQRLLLDSAKLNSVSTKSNDQEAYAESSENSYRLDRSEWNLTRMSLFICHTGNNIGNHGSAHQFA